MKREGRGKTESRLYSTTEACIKSKHTRSWVCQGFGGGLNVWQIETRRGRDVVHEGMEVRCMMHREVKF